MSKLGKLFEMLNEIDYQMLIEKHDCIWTFTSDDYIHWNTENNKEDLYNGDGQTYGMYLPEGFHINKEEGYIVFNGDTETDCWVTTFLLLDKEIEYEDLEEEFG